MSDDPDNLTLRYLRRLDAKVDRIADDLSDVKTDVRSLKIHMAGFMQNEIAQDNAIAAIQSRLDRIERRLDLNDGAP